jgi:molybdopterin molybdotransferase
LAGAVSALLSVAEAQARLLALASVLPVESVPLVDANGRWAAEPIAARRTQPFADLSAMDGYAIRFAELPGPWTVVSESSAGSPLPPALERGQAARIFTGAPVPTGADTILVQEDAVREGDRLMLSGEGPGRQGKHIRLRGNDFHEGANLIAQGALITPAQIALATVGGHATLPVRRRAKLALISTGSELVAPGIPRASHQLPSSNAPMLAALLNGPDAEVEDLGIAPDDLEAIVAAVGRASDADIILTTGGASVGDHDLVKPAFEAAGARLDFWKVAMRPGKPLMAGMLGRQIILGLPGNPVSAFVTASLFAKPLIAALGGAAEPLSAPRVAALAAPIPENGERAHYMRGRWRDGGVMPLDGQDSAALTDLAAATLLIVRRPHVPAAAAGEIVEIIDIA